MPAHWGPTDLIGDRRRIKRHRAERSQDLHGRGIGQPVSLIEGLQVRHQHGRGPIERGPVLIDDGSFDPFWKRLPLFGSTDHTKRGVRMHGTSSVLHLAVAKRPVLLRHFDQVDDDVLRTHPELRVQIVGDPAVESLFQFH
jgi:hypothetical protein